MLGGKLANLMQGMPLVSHPNRRCIPLLDMLLYVSGIPQGYMFGPVLLLSFSMSKLNGLT